VPIAFSTAIDARAVDATIPRAGIPRRFMVPKRSRNRPSSAAARGISAVTIVQPFRAPIPETITTAAIT
jgi:hypothetical protein